MIIGINGLVGAGKSTAAAYLVREHGFALRRFAGPLKAMMIAFGLTTEQVDGDLKEVPCELLGGKTPRQAMHWLGTEWGRDLIDPGIWVRAWEASLPEPGIPVVCDDVRFPNEAASIRLRGGHIIHMVGRRGAVVEHVSETYRPPGAITVDNSGPPEALERVLDDLVTVYRRAAA